MRASVLIGLLSVSLIAGCQSTSGNQGEPEAPQAASEPDSPTTSQVASEVETPTTRQSALPSCCKDSDEVAALDGKRVEMRGIYQKVNVSRRPSPLDLTVPGSASVGTVMLGVYYEASGVRSVAEIQSLHDKEVIVTGTIHARTPEQVHDGIPMQTMIGPYIDVESVRVAK